MISRSIKGVFAAVAVIAVTSGADDYQLGPDSKRKEGVPQGRVEKYSWTNSTVYPGTVRDYFVYVPAQYQAAEPACVMVFQDGPGYVSTNGSYRVPVVFDNLIHEKTMPVTIGVFIDHGKVLPTRSNALPRFNRSFEYDALGDRYARFLLEEILPEVGKKYNLTTNATGRAIGGASSGAIAAFSVAWERPDQFSRVFSTIGTYVGLRGGDEYATLVRKTEPKPIRVFLQDGSNDLNIYAGDWWNANLGMLSALTWAGYDVKHVWGDGGHNGKHGGAIFPEAMRWLWRDYPQPIAKPGADKRTPLNEILVEGEDWQLVSEGHRFTEGPAVNDKGEVFFTDIPNDKIHKIGLDGKVTTFAENTGGANGLMFNSAGELLACANKKRQIVKYSVDGKTTVLAEDVGSNDIAVLENGGFYFTDPDARQVWFSPKDGKPRVVDTGIQRPNGLILTPDQNLLIVADTAGPMAYSFQVREDGGLAHKQPYFHLHMPAMSSASGADGMTVDTQGRLYVTTAMGIQVCDQAGRVNGIIAKPQRAWLANVVFGGPDLDTLYATCGDKVYKRKTKAKGVVSWRAPVVPPAPRL